MPNDYDRVFKENIEPLLPYLCRKLLGLEFPKLEDIKDKIQITLEREMDNLKKVVHEGQPWLDFGLHWEIQSTDEDMRARQLVYYALFFQKYSMPLKQILIYVGNERPKKILQNVLETEGVRLEFAVVDLKSIPKEVFLHSDTPEEVVLAILCDFGVEQPEQVIRQILQHLLKLIGRVPRLKKYQQQLQVLSRLRKLEIPTKKEITAMPIHYEIEQDGLYLEGIEKGIEKGIEQHQHDTVVRGLRAGVLSLEMIANLAGVPLEYVLETQKELESQSKNNK